uniref:Smr protein/MutS2 n=1 Tax=Rhodopseudomonas palustris (strain BisA53) TaxID=316055 RepID=Q07UQ2_RHOP5
MKKLPPNSEFEPPASRRRRTLSPHEHELWESVARQVKPLRKPRVVKAAPPAPAEPMMRASTLSSAKKPTPPRPPETPKRETPRGPPPLAPLGRRERSHLSRGRKPIDGRIDLHGMTQTRAHAVLLHFLQRASADGMSFVLVITGKGRSVGAESERGVLRRQVPHWLGLPEFRAHVVGFEEAAIGHGGEGALYVRVRRGRS